MAKGRQQKLDPDKEVPCPEGFKPAMSFRCEEGQEFWLQHRSEPGCYLGNPEKDWSWLVVDRRPVFLCKETGKWFTAPDLFCAVDQSGNFPNYYLLEEVRALVA